MQIIAQKTAFYLNDQFYNDVLNQSYVDGISLSILYNVDHQLLIYDFTTSEEFNAQKMQNNPISEIISTNVTTLETALDIIQNKYSQKPIYLNLIPVSINIVDDVTLKQVNDMNIQYLEKLEKVLKHYSTLNISLHSVSRNLTLLLQSKFPDKKIGFVVYGGDLTPIDVDYYVFPIHMMDDAIFEELVKRKKELFIYIRTEDELAFIIQKYDSEKTTALASEMFSYFNFITNVPVIVARVFDKFLKKL